MQTRGGRASDFRLAISAGMRRLAAKWAGVMTPCRFYAGLTRLRRGMWYSQHAESAKAERGNHFLGCISAQAE